MSPHSVYQVGKAESVGCGSNRCLVQSPLRQSELNAVCQQRSSTCHSDGRSQICWISFVYRSQAVLYTPAFIQTMEPLWIRISCTCRAAIRTCSTRVHRVTGWTTTQQYCKTTALVDLSVEMHSWGLELL